jgi:hypothetical protein
MASSVGFPLLEGLLSTVVNIEEKVNGSDHVTWNSAASSLMLNHLFELVTNGIRTSSGFKKIHLNMCT